MMDARFQSGAVVALQHTKEVFLVEPYEEAQLAVLDRIASLLWKMSSILRFVFMDMIKIS